MTIFSSGTIRAGNDRAVIKFAKASVAASQTDSSVVAAVSGKKIRVLGVILSGASATSVTFNSKPAGAGSAIAPAMIYTGNSVQSLAATSIGYFETAAGEGLTVTTGAGGTSAIGVVYIEVA